MATNTTRTAATVVVVAQTRTAARRNDARSPLWQQPNLLKKSRTPRARRARRRCGRRCQRRESLRQLLLALTLSRKEEEEEVVVVMVGIDSAWEQGVISPTQYQALSRMNIFEIDPKNLPAAISEKGGNGLGGGRRR
mmetsp:Transcript_7214/g.13451  ORF Transcript_7214/g.13451 Transcript_7214/m.13451 type:complete len:137 (+) Transcript_7214:661-1071(+)